MHKFMKKILPGAASFLLLGAIPCLSNTASAADFQVAIKRLSVTQCSLTGSMLNIDPNTGNVSIDINTDVNCYPSAVNALASSASISVVGPTTVGGGQTGQGNVDLQLNTGLAGVTTGVTCVPDGVSASNVNVVSGWSTTLCTNCGPSATRTVTVQNPTTTVNGSITFRAKCTYQDPGNANLATVRSNIVSTQPVTVQPGTAPPPPDFCTSVTELATPNGLTEADRMLSGAVTGGTLPGGNVDFLNYTSVFGVSPNVVAPGNPDNLGFGFPGTNRVLIQLGVPRGKYLSLKFRAPTHPNWNGTTQSHGAFQVIPNGALTLAAIAPCPGQFANDPDYPMANVCRIIGKSSNLYAQITSGSTTKCKLEPGKTYHLNVIQAAGWNQLTTPSCSGVCAPKVQVQGFPDS